jgi:hypothetical protein
MYRFLSLLPLMVVLRSFKGGQSANKFRKSQILKYANSQIRGLNIFKFADLAKIWQFADHIFFAICVKLPQIRNNSSPQKYRLKTLSYKCIDDLLT